VIAVVGAGVFGTATALELVARGYQVTLLDPGPLPHPLAASTDISKVIRMEYGPDEDYMALGEKARANWLEWNAAWQAQGAEPLYHETGVLMISRSPMASGGFEFESWQMLQKRGHQPQRMSAGEIARRFPAWRKAGYADGFFHTQGGYAESGRVVEAMVRRASAAGVRLVAGRVVALIEQRGRVVGVVDDHGAKHPADEVVVAAGAWTAKLLVLSDEIRPTGHPVFHLRPKYPELFRAERFPVFTADIARTGYYGFPLNRDGVVKVSNHGLGLALDPDAPRAVTREQADRLRIFLAETFPALADAEVVYTRLCLYADSQDGDFWIARDPDRRGLTVATGDSGHGFKFAPVLGTLIADAMEGKPNPLLERFRWRPEVRLAHNREAARFHGAVNR
jgi:glycine/D-amino acid oxidase-like deaminating enzyme